MPKIHEHRVTGGRLVSKLPCCRFQTVSLPLLTLKRSTYRTTTAELPPLSLRRTAVPPPLSGRCHSRGSCLWWCSAAYYYSGATGLQPWPLIRATAPPHGPPIAEHALTKPISGSDIKMVAMSTYVTDVCPGVSAPQTPVRRDQQSHSQRSSLHCLTSPSIEMFHSNQNWLKTSVQPRPIWYVH